MPQDQSKIHYLSLSKNVDDRLEAAKLLKDEFRILSNKSVAWAYLIRLTSDKNLDVRRSAANALGSAFCFVPEEHKSAAWVDLVRLTSDKDSYVRRSASFALGSAFMFVPDKSAAWADLHSLTNDLNWDVRDSIAHALGTAFSSIPAEYKSAAWADLHSLTSDGHSEVKENAAHALGSAFRFIPEEHKSAAWADLHKLTSDENWSVRWKAAHALGSAFSFVPEEHKSAAWADLHRLTSSGNWSVRWGAADSLGSAFPSFSEEYKYTALVDLIRLTNDNRSDVRMYSNHSLGKICIYNASKSENENDSRALLGEAIIYFEKAAKERDVFNPAIFCNLFYRSFDAVIFKKVYSKKEIDEYITAAKKEIGHSESKQKLIEAVEQLAEVLEIAHDIHESGGDWQESLKRCSDICNHVDQVMDENKDKTPAIHGLYKKVKPSFDKTIENLIIQVKEKAEAACREAKGTPAEDAACAVSREVHKWKIGSQEYMCVQIQCTVSMLRSYVSDIEDNDSILNEINSILQEEDVVIQYMRFNSLVPQIINIRESRITEFSEEMKALRKAVSKLSESIDELQNPQEYLDTIQRNLEEIKDEIPAMKKQIDDVLLELYSPMGIDQKLKVAIPIIPLLASYEIEINTPKFVVDRIDELKNLVLKFKK